MEIIERISTEYSKIWRGVRVAQLETKYQKCVILDTKRMGKALFIDGEKQSMTLNDTVYHECLTVPALVECRTKEEIKKVLLIGCSEGSVYDVLKRSKIPFTLEHIDLDRECMEFCAKYLPYGYTEEILYNPPSNLKITIGDGADKIKYLQNETYDIIIIDIPEYPTMPGIHAEEIIANLYTEEFYKECYRILKPMGSLLTEAGSPNVWRMWSLVLIHNTIEKIIGSSKPVKSAECNWAYVVACKTRDYLISDFNPCFKYMKYIDFRTYESLINKGPLFDRLKNKMRGMTITKKNLFPLKEKDREFFTEPI